MVKIRLSSHSFTLVAGSFAVALATARCAPAEDVDADSDGPATAVQAGGSVRPTVLHGSVVCAVRDGTAYTDAPLAELTLDLEGYGTVTTDAEGRFRHRAPYGGGDVSVRAVYEGAITDPVNGARSTLRVMDDVFATRSDRAVARGLYRVVRRHGPMLDLGTVRLGGVDCEVWRIGREILRGYHGVHGTGIPRGQFKMMRRFAVDVTVPYVPYDYVDLPTNLLDRYPYSSTRLHTLTHEFGHVIRDLADGDDFHWHWDNVRFRYARVHTGLEVAEDGEAFHEGWADYWAAAQRDGHARLPTGAWSSRHMDWVENLVANRLLDLAERVGGDAVMLETLERNPGTIHSLYQFESRLCADGRCGSLARPAPDACPPEYHNDGLTCRLDNIRAKPSYGRGVGAVPDQCGAGRENNAGLCYPTCRDNFRGVGPVCWEFCPAGYQDDGATCRRDVHIFGSDNSRCPWYDICGLTFARGCSTCPAGYQNDGCTCRRDAHIFAKNSYGRGVGTIPNGCGTGRTLDAGLCYAPCAEGYHGVGPVCWGSCPAGWADHGATCYREPHVISRYP